MIDSIQPINAPTTSGSVNAMRDNGDHSPVLRGALLAVSTPIFMYKRSTRDADGRNKRFISKNTQFDILLENGGYLSLSISYYVH